LGFACLPQAGSLACLPKPRRRQGFGILDFYFGFEISPQAGIWKLFLAGMRLSFVCNFQSTA